MMTYRSLAAGGFEAHSKTTRKAAFLARMDKLMPWAALQCLVEPHYPKAGNGRLARSLQTMLRMYCVANSFNLADEASAKTRCTTLRHLETSAALIWAVRVYLTPPPY